MGGDDFGTTRLKATVVTNTVAYCPPGAGANDAVDPTKYRETKQPAASFGGTMAAVDRTKTGYLQEAFQFRAPGPGTYEGISSMDKQGDSTKPTSSKHKFNKADRDDFPVKCYMPGMRQEGTARHVPGPGTYSPNSVDYEGRGSSKSRAPVYSFGGPLGKVRRCDGTGLVHLTGTDAQCGPGAHNVETSMQTMASSTKATSARATFGTGNRDQAEVIVAPGYTGKSKETLNNPGPGTYVSARSMGYQASSVKKSSANFKFGTETRDRVTKMRTRDLLATPGPGNYKIAAGLGRQGNSKYRSTNRALFGTSARKPIGIVHLR